MKSIEPFLLDQNAIKKKQNNNIIYKEFPKAKNKCKIDYQQM